MAAVNRNMFDASVSADPPHARGATVMILPLNLIAQIISHVRRCLSALSQTDVTLFRRLAFYRMSLAIRFKPR